MGGDRVVHLVAADADRGRDHDAAQGDDRDLGRAAADVDDHAAGGLLDREIGADRGGHRLVDQHRPPGARRLGRLADRALLHLRDPARHAEDDARRRHAPAERLLDEVVQHRLGHLEVRDHAVAKRPDRPDRGGRAADHLLRVGADRVDVAGRVVDRDDGRLEEDDPLAADEDDGVGGAEVDRHVAAPDAVS